MTISTAAIASAGITLGRPGITVQPIVSTRKNVPMNSVRYLPIFVAPSVRRVSLHQARSGLSSLRPEALHLLLRDRARRDAAPRLPRADARARKHGRVREDHRPGADDHVPHDGRG